MVRAANVKSEEGMKEEQQRGLPSLNGLRHRSRWPDSNVKKAQRSADGERELSF